MARTIPPDRFQDLIEAATQVFLEQGYQRTQVADVAARMGVSKGSIYSYVESKEALFDCVLRHADNSRAVELPKALPVPAPRPGATLQAVRRRLESEGSLPLLTGALAKKRVGDVAGELQGILAELYDALARHRTAIKLLDRCAPDYPELAKLWFGGSREGTLALLARYLEDCMRRGHLRAEGEPAVVARIALETLVFWAVHRHWDPSPQALDEENSRRTVLAFLGAALARGDLDGQV